LLKLAKAAKDKAARAKYRAAAEATITALVTHYLTPTSPADKRPPGILTESCFNKRLRGARPFHQQHRCLSRDPTVTA
jgi:unsaturated chondroitin disaccharide hydrolase